jgi:cysteine-rich repeat protein
MAKQRLWLFGILIGLLACKADQLQIGDDPLADGGLDLGTGGTPIGSGGAVAETGGTPGSGGSIPSIGSGGAVSETGGMPGSGGSIPPIGSGGAIIQTGGTPGSGGSIPPSSDLMCGDGVLEGKEACDDGNSMAFDGCNGLCQVEAGFVCAVPGQPCVLVAICGNGIVTSTETCDDGNTAGGDGCSANCMAIERGWYCPVPGKPCRPRCGDGLIVAGETCDDGNAVGGDGCSNTCHVEPGASCPAPGQPCGFAFCGNGTVETGEACDCGTDPAHLPAGCLGINGISFGNGGGCTESCTPEPRCVDAAGKTQACTTTCGDGKVDPGEQCDDGNLTSGDGCSSKCGLESGYSCTATASGAGVPCSTGNAAKCLRLPITYRDFQPENAAAGGHPDFFFLGARYGGSSSPTTICVPNSAGPAHGNDATKRCWGIAADSLVNGKPQAGTTTTCDCQFSDWSIANAGYIPGNYTQAGNDSPLSDGKGGFLAEDAGSAIRVTGAAGVSDGILTGYTMSTPGGPVFAGKVPAYKDASSFAQWYSDDPTVNTTFASVLELAAVGTGVYQYANQVHLADGGFFPLDALNPSQATLCNLWPYWNHGNGTPFWTTCIGDQYYSIPRVNTSTDCGGALGCWVKDVTGVRHDSYFTFETRYHFTYDSATGLVLSVYGDDDIFVYINGTLVLDLGGVHQPLPGKVTITGNPGNAVSTEGGCLDTAGNIVGVSEGSTACAPVSGSAVAAASPDDFRARTVKLGLASGKTYEMAIFGADRHPPESNFQLTLAGNGASRSECAPRCGDGVVVAGEECDAGDANNDSMYGGCSTRCQLGPHCGDGVVSGPEECDLGAGNGQPGAGGCTLACTRAHYCGDGIADGVTGEQCDLGAENGKVGSRCSSDCRLLATARN